MIKTITVAKVDFFSQDKEKKPLTYVSKKTGKTMPYWKCRIKTDTEDIWMSVFSKSVFDEIQSWEPGTQHEVEVIQNGQYTNYRLPKPKTASDFALEDLTARVKRLEDKVFPQTHPLDGIEEPQEPDEEEDPDPFKNIPF